MAAEKYQDEQGVMGMGFCANLILRERTEAGAKTVVACTTICFDEDLSEYTGS